MTCIIGMERDGTVYMGGDSASASGYDCNVTILPKVFTVKARGERFMIGYTSSFRMGQLLEFHLGDHIETGQTGRNDLAYLVKTFIPAVRQCLKDGGYLTINNNEESIGQFLLGYRQHLYFIDGDLQVNSHRNGIAAVGCGADYALGSLHEQLTSKVSRTPRAMIKRALDAAGTFSCGVCGPYRVCVL